MSNDELVLLPFSGPTTQSRAHPQQPVCWPVADGGMRRLWLRQTSLGFPRARAESHASVREEQTAAAPANPPPPS